MATSKTKHKKKSNDKFVSYVVIGFAIAFFVLVASLIIFNSMNNDFEDSPLLNKPEDQYLVYLYSDNCSYCILIQDEVNSFKESNNANLKLYKLNTTELRDGEFEYLAETYGATGTPAMFTVVNGEVVDLLSGSVQIPNTFDAINNGTYSKIN
jgi:thiol-disulfide isomerase/thioredoxin